MNPLGLKCTHYTVLTNGQGNMENVFAWVHLFIHTGEIQF